MIDAIAINNTVTHPNTAPLSDVTLSLVGNPNLSLNPSGLFTLSGSPDATYLIQTRPLFTDFASFMSSDYMMNRLGINFTGNSKRLGDGFYEQKLVQDQVLQLTGRRFLAGYGSNQAQFQALMDAGVMVAERYELTPGVALTANQTAALTADIVWLEEREVAGQKVRVPVVYLARVHKNDLDSFGPLVAAADIDLKLAGDLTNGGTIRAERMLRVDAANITNRSGTLAGGDKLYLNAANDLLNQSGTLKGGDIDLTAGRDFRHETVFVYSDNGAVQATTAGRQAVIDATGDVNVQAGRDITLTAAKVTAGNDVTLAAGRDLTLTAAAKEQHVAVLFDGARYERTTRENLLSTIESGGNTTLRAANDAVLKGAHIAAAHDLTLAARNVTLAAVMDREFLDAAGDHGQGSYERIRNDDEAVRGSDLAAGNNITIRARSQTEHNDPLLRESDNAGADNAHPDTHQGNLTVEGSRIRAGAHLALGADHDIVIKEARELHASLSEKRDVNVGVTKTRSNYERSEQMTDLALGSTLNGGTVTAQSGNDIHVQGSQLNAQGKMVLNAGQDLNITHAEQIRIASKRSESTRAATGLGKMLGTVTSVSGAINEGAAILKQKIDQQSADQTRSQAIGSGIAAGSIETYSARDTRIQGSTLVADADIDIAAGRNLGITSAQDTQRDKTHSNSKTTGFIGSWWQPTIGSVKQNDDNQGDSASTVSSQIVSLGTEGRGSVRLMAHDQYTQTASQVLNPQGDIDIRAKNVLINEAYTTNVARQQKDASKVALGGSISVPLIDAVKGIASMDKAVSQTRDNRMQAVAAINTVLYAQKAISGVHALSSGSLGGIKVSASLGSDKSESSSTQIASTVVGSTVAAGGDVNISATGAGLDSNLTVIGSHIEAGNMPP